MTLCGGIGHDATKVYNSLLQVVKYTFNYHTGNGEALCKCPCVILQSSRCMPRLLA